MMIRKVKKINLLNFIDYNKETAIKELEENVGWQYYGGKHYESIFTQFFQAYVLPTKFGFDKRRAHLSSLICSGQISREDAILELKNPLYETTQLEEHINYIIKKWEISKEEFEHIMNLPPKKHEDYPSNKKWVETAIRMKNQFRI
jgi:hypothetical protein